MVTGEQFAGLDLRHAKLVVLSACESGVGERVLGEGVCGLQRAFHVAGVSDVVATLWPVADADAVAFMDLFYGFLLDDDQPSPAAALRKAQLAMSERKGAAASAHDQRRRGIKFDFQKKPDESARTQSQKPATSRATWAAFFLSRG